MGRLRIAVFAAVFFGFIAAYGIYNFLLQQRNAVQQVKVPTQDLLVAAKDIEPGTSLTKELLKVNSWTVSSVPEGTFAKADEVIGKGRRFAAWMLEAAEADIVFEDGIFRVSGTDRQVGFRDVARRSYAGGGVPRELGIGLDGVGAHEGPNTYPNGCIVCEVEVDPETGVITVDRLSAVDDVGFAVNPLTLHGQLHGSVAQGLGEALIEEMVYDRENGQLLTGSFLDYGMPRADIMPDIAAEMAMVPTKTNLLGVKGGSEAGNVATPAAIVNAVLDALSPWCIEDLPLPATPERIWRSIQGAAASL